MAQQENKKDSGMKIWLKCEISVGQLSGEFVVMAKDFRGTAFSLFVPDDFVDVERAPNSDEIVDGWLEVDVIDANDRMALIKLPRTPLENGQTVTVNTNQLAQRKVFAFA